MSKPFMSRTVKLASGGTLTLTVRGKSLFVAVQNAADEVALLNGIIDAMDAYERDHSPKPSNRRHAERTCPTA